MRMAIKEFVVSKHISIRLEGTEIYIYIDGNRFKQCASLVLNIPIDKIEDFDDIKSIEEAVERLESTEGWDQLSLEYHISPEEEFFGHCSNIQAWYESGYNSNILHYTLSFSLLQELAKYDSVAKAVLREEVAKRLATGYENVTNYIYESRLILLLSHDEILDILLHPEDAEIFHELESVLQAKVYISNEDKFPRYSYSGRDYLATVEDRRIVSLRLGSSKLDIIPDVICKFKNITDLFFKDLNNLNYLPDLLKHLFIWQDSDFIWHPYERLDT